MHEYVKKEILERYLPLVKARALLEFLRNALHFPTLSHLVKA